MKKKTQVKNYKTLRDAEEAFRNLSSSVDWRTAYRETGTKLLDLVLQGQVDDRARSAESG